MKLEDIEKLCIPNPMENRYGDCFPIEIAQKLLAVAKASKILADNTDGYGDSPSKLRFAMYRALDDLEKKE